MQLIELPRGLWKWIARNGRDLGRIARALEKMAEELAEIRRTLQKTDNRKEQNR